MQLKPWDEVAVKPKWNFLAPASIHIIEFISRKRYIHVRTNIKEGGKMGTALTSLKKIKSKYIGIWLKDQLSQPDWNSVLDFLMNIEQ